MHVATPSGDVIPPAPVTAFEKQWSQLDLAINNLMKHFRENMQLTFVDGYYVNWIVDYNSRLMQAQICVSNVDIHGRRWCKLAKMEKQETVKAYQTTLDKRYVSFAELAVETQNKLPIPSSANIKSFNEKTALAHLPHCWSINNSCRESICSAIKVFAELVKSADSLDS